MYYWHNLRESVRTDMHIAYGRQTRTLGAATGARIQQYENFLRSSAGLFTVYNNTTQADWDKFYAPYEIEKKYPDIVNVGLARYLQPTELTAFYERRQAQGDTNYQIFPQGDRSVYVPVTFDAAYRYEARDIGRGFDSYTDPARRQAMQRAIQTGEPGMTSPITLVSESGAERTGFVLYLPVFRQGQPIATAEQRQTAIAGFSYVTVDMDRLLDTVIKNNQSPYIGVRIQDQESGDLAYQSDNFATVSAEDGSHEETSKSELYGQPWQITLAASPQILSAREWQLPDQALWRGFLTCVFFAGLVWYLITDRERKYARQKQQEVQTAKDDLLSLASHQLRTPATVVKQYVGMLLQGYGGKLSPQQVGMLTNAYESNERQLEIINQLLYVARLDAGRIKLRHEERDIVKLLRDVARDQKEALQQRNHKLSYKLPKKPLLAMIDPHYTRMVVENLLTNAIKYTPDGGLITLHVEQDDDMAVISVTDTGVGISAEVQANIFEKFTRVENELSTDVNGSGVGLYLTQQIVELHGGTISVESTPSQGSTFTVRLPIKGAPPTPASDEAE
jgi:signal transduction histidine kinase